MRVGIITLFDNENFGNRLQNYALQQILLGFFDKVVTIKNKPEFKSLKQKITRSSFLAESPFINRLIGKKRKAKFLEFNKKYIKLNRKTYCFNRDYYALSLADKCDMYCAGSDQIWNPNLKRSGYFNFLGFSDNMRTFSYAASFGIDKIDEKYKKDISRGLMHINHISVREDAGAQIVKELCGRDAEVLIDPTLMLGQEEWDKIAVKPQNLDGKKYALLYFLGKIPSDREKAIKKAAEEKGCVLINVLDKNSPFYEIGPSEFVYLIKNAEFICTDSFHASVFSFIYKKPLVIFPRADKNLDMNSRIETLTRIFSLENAVSKDEKFPENWDKPDYSCSENALEKEKLRAKAFLEKIFTEGDGEWL